MTAYLSELAFNDLENIWDFVANGSVEKANEYVFHLENRINNLSENPLCGRKRIELSKDLFSFPIDNYIIFYEIESEKQIYVVRILHTARDNSSIILH